MKKSLTKRIVAPLLILVLLLSLVPSALASGASLDNFKKALDLGADASVFQYALDELSAALYEAGKAAETAGDNETALEYFRLAGDFDFSVE